ncbi:diguanylate cyclase [Pseudomaricurvus alkylphenolicus]|nr:diguanylate cyclase [Pseudomaricurvus alkylphenolicus]
MTEHDYDENTKVAEEPIILIVDDDRLNLNLLNDLLKDGHRIRVALDGQQALQRARMEPRPDLILMDVVMPKLTGFEVCEQLKREAATADIPVLFITARTSEEDEIRGLSLGGADFISKPIRPEIVRARVKTHLTQLRQKRELQVMHQKLLALSIQDPLTGLTNRRGFDEFLQREWSRCLRSGSHLGLLMLDVDHFKCYNDHYGHLQGDDCLQQLAITLAEQVRRPSDLLARFGGEEFVCVLPDTGLEGVRQVGQAMLQAVRELNRPHGGCPGSAWVSVSIGGTSIVPHGEHTTQQFLQKADQLLYEAKRRGRDTLVVSGSRQNDVAGQ